MYPPSAINAQHLPVASLRQVHSAEKIAFSILRPNKKSTLRVSPKCDNEARAVFARKSPRRRERGMCLVIKTQFPAHIGNGIRARRALRTSPGVSALRRCAYGFSRKYIVFISLLIFLSTRALLQRNRATSDKPPSWLHRRSRVAPVE